MRLLQLSVALVLATAGAAAADCAKLNSSHFLESTSWDLVIDCVERSPAVMATADDRGFNLLMTAITSNIDPMALDDLFTLIPEELADDVLRAVDRQGRSLAHVAASEGADPAFIFVLSSNGGSVWQEISGDLDPTRGGQNAVHLAAEREDGVAFVAALMTLVDDLAHLEDGRGETPLDIALAKDIIGPEALLLADGEWPALFNDLFDPEPTNPDADCGILMTAQFFERATEGDVVACLVEENQILAVDRDGNSILHLASLHAEDPWIIDQILNAAGDPKTLLEKRNSAGKTALHLSAENGKSADVLLHLLAWGADPNTTLNPSNRRLGKDRGVSALHLAASRKDDLREYMVLMLLAFEADTLLQDTAVGDAPSATTGRTALHRALLEPDPVVMLMLLEGQFMQENLFSSIFRNLMGKTVKQISDDAGRTAMHMAASRSSDFETLDLLRWYGFSVDEKDTQGDTPLMFAAKSFEDVENFLFLLDASDSPCEASRAGVTVEAALRANEVLMQDGADDMTGRTLSPLAFLKQRCP